MGAEADLEALLTLWRTTHHPRVADAIDRVSDELLAHRGPVDGTSITKRFDAAMTLARGKDPADLGRLTSLPWPGTWQKGLPLLITLVEGFADDPRLQQLLARTFASPPWTSQASWGFFRHLHAALTKATDVRLVPLLEQGDALNQPFWYRNFQPGVRALIARLNLAQVTEVSGADLTLLERVEARTMDQRRQQAEKATGEPHFLEDIAARPDDLQARAVFADWLTERNDPRGEFITLQLTPAPTRAQASRQKQLLAKHGSSSAGPLGAWFVKDKRLFEGGFLVGGVLVDRAPQSLEDALTQRPWRLVHTLEKVWRLPLEDFAPLFPWLRSLHTVRFEELSKQRGALPALESLTLDDVSGEKNVLSSGVALPRLHTLGLADARDLEHLPTRGAGMKRLSTLRLRDTSEARAAIERVTIDFPQVTTLELLSGKGWLFPDGPWRIVLRRAAGPGPFTEVFATTTKAEVLDAIARAVDPPSVTKLTLEASRTLALRADERATTDAQLAAFTRATVVVPWDRAAPRTVVKTRGDRLVLSLWGTFLTKQLEPLWRHLGAGGFAFDGYSVGYGGTPRPLGPKPAEVLSKWGANARCSRLEVYRDGTDEKLALFRARHGYPGGLRLEFRWNGRAPESFAEWVEGAVALAGDVSLGMLDEADAANEGLFGHETGRGRLLVYGKALRAQLPEKKLVAAVTSLGGVARATPQALLFGPGPLDEKPTERTVNRLHEALWPMALASFRERTGIDFEREVKKAMGPLAKQLGLTERTPPGDRGSVRVHYAKGRFSLQCELRRLLVEPIVDLELRHQLEAHTFRTLPLAEGPFDSKRFPAQLEAARKRLAAEGPGFLANPTPPPSRRR